MHIIIIANHQPAALAPLTDNGSLATLPVGGKMLIEHLLENVASVQHSKMTIVASRGFNSLRQFIGSGERWGLNIKLVTSRPNEPIASLKRRQPSMFQGKVLLLAADRIYTKSLANNEFILQQASETNAKLAHQNTNAHSEDLVQILQPATSITDFKEYLDLNLAAARGEISQISLRGRERALGLTTGYRSTINPRSVRLGQTHAGNHCRVDKSANLHGTVVLDSSVVIDRNTEIKDSMVLQHTYVGEQLNLERCIVSGRYIIRADEQVVLKLADSFMAAPLRKGMYTAHFAGPLNQLMGVGAGIAALPLMGAALVMGLWENPYQPIVKKTWVSNYAARAGNQYRTFDTFEFNVNNRAMRKLPQILDVSLGHLRWFGVSVATAEELDNRNEPWQMTRDNSPAGIFGTAQINDEHDTSTEERFLNDAAYVQTASFLTNLGILGDALAKLTSGDRENRAEVQVS